MINARPLFLGRRSDKYIILIPLDSNGNVVVKYKYDAWGNHAVLNPDGSENENSTFIGNVNPVRYRGYYYDTETGLYYLKSRYYDPETGRFITIDDVSYLAPETINGLNLYAYCGNNPVMRVDENGTAWWHWVLGSIAVIALGAVVVGAAILAVMGGSVSLVSIGIGFAIGATSSFIGQGISNISSGNNFFENINIAEILLGGLVGAAYATGLGGIAGALGIGFASSVASSAYQKKPLNEIIRDGLINSLISGISYGVGQILGRAVFKNSDLVFSDFMEMAKADGAKFVKAAITAFKSSWYTFLPSISPGLTRAILGLL